MSEEEKLAIDILQNCIADYVIGDYCGGEYCPQDDACKNDDCPFEKAIDTVINLIEKQQKEIEELNNIIYENNFDYNDEGECLIRKYYHFNRKAYEKICCSDITCKKCIDERLYKRLKEK